MPRNAEGRGGGVALRKKRDPGNEVITHPLVGFLEKTGSLSSDR